MITRKMTIGEAIKTNPDIIQILSEESIDFCCGGHRALEDALIDKNIDVDSFIELLNRHDKAENNTIEDALKLNKENLVDYIIRNHHVKELRLLDEIDKYMQKLVDVHYEGHGIELTNIYGIFMTIKSDMIPHFAKEERIDFPVFLNEGSTDFDELIKEHEHVGSLLEQLEGVTNNFTAPSDGCLTYKHTFKLLKELRDDIHQHIFLENSVLFLM